MSSAEKECRCCLLVSVSCLILTSDGGALTSLGIIIFSSGPRRVSSSVDFGTTTDSLGPLWSCTVAAYGYSSSGSVCVATSLVVMAPSSISSSSSSSQLSSGANFPLYFDLLSAVYGRECENAEKRGLEEDWPPKVEFRLGVASFGTPGGGGGEPKWSV